MRKLEAFLLLVGLLLLPQVALAEASGPDFFRVTGVAADDVLNIRVAADAASTKVGEIPPNADGVRSLGCEGGLNFTEWQAASEAERAVAAHRRWCRIAYGGVEGWVAGRFLVEGAAPAPPASDGGGAGPGDPPYWAVTYPPDVLVVRAAPAESGAAVAEFQPGTVLRNLGCEEAGGATWCQVSSLRKARVWGWAPATGLDAADAALRAGQGAFDATGLMPCRQNADQAMQDCAFGVVREGGGSASVAVVRPDGITRFLTFVDGNFVSADTSQADGYPEYGATREGYVTVVHVGEERYEVFDAAIFGG